MSGAEAIPLVAGGAEAATAATPFLSAGTLASLGLTAASAIAQKASQDAAVRRQEALNTQATQYKSAQAAKGREAITRYLDTVQPAQRAAEADTAKQNLEAGLNQSVSDVQQATVPDNFQGKVSGDYTRVRDQTNAAANERLKAAIGRLAVLGAPAQNQLSDAIRFGRTVSDVNNANTASANVGNTFTNAINLARPDPTLAFAGDILSGVNRSGVLRRSLSKSTPGTITPNYSNPLAFDPGNGAF